MIPLLTALFLALPVQPDTGKVVLLDVSARAPSADTILVVRTAGLSRGQLLTSALLRTDLEDAIRRVYGLGLFSQVNAETSRVADGVRVTAFKDPTTGTFVINAINEGLSSQTLNSTRSLKRQFSATRR